MNKEVQIRFRIDQDTEKIIREEEKKYRSRSDFLRAQLDKVSPLGKQKEVLIELEKTRMEIHKIGVNINQIAKNNNSELYSDQDKKI